MAASLTVTRSVTEIQNLLVCDVRKKTINEPKILPCSHSFCKACLENLTTQDEKNVDGEGKKLDCPTCTSTVTLKPNEYNNMYIDCIIHAAILTLKHTTTDLNRNKTPTQAFTPPADEKKMGTIWIFGYYLFFGLKVGEGLDFQIWDLNGAHETERTGFPI